MLKRNKKDKVKKEKKVKVKKDKKEKKKSDPINSIIFAGFSILIIVFVIITLFAVNLFGIKDKLVNQVVTSLLSEQLETEATKLGEEYASKYERDFGIHEKELADKEQALITREENLKKSEDEFLIEKTAMQETLAGLEAREKEIYGVKENIEEISDVVGDMDAGKAATMLANMDDIDLITNIIFSLKKDQAASILEQLSPYTASKITQGRYNDGVEE